jgi:hypothetical protein
MTDKASPAGWVVQVTIAASPPKEADRWIGAKLPDAPSFEYFNVGIADPGEAVQATAAYLAKGGTDVGSVPASAVRELSPAEVVALRLKAGEVRPA